MGSQPWAFVDGNGSFRWENPDAVNELYFPLCNEAGLMSSITPVLHGDIKQNQQAFLLQPVSVEDLHNSKAARNFWIYEEGQGPWSVTGNSAAAHAARFDEPAAANRTVEAGLLYHTVIYEDLNRQLTSEVCNFIPSDNDKVEIMTVKITNNASTPTQITATSAIPIYGRSADNIRDHRHVTSLVNRPQKHPFGVTMQPVILFDETGHKWNDVLYFVFGSEKDGTAPVGTIASIENFIGSCGDLEWPEAIVKNLSADLFCDENLEGKECIGALRFRPRTLAAGESADYIILMGITTAHDDLEALYSRYNTLDKVHSALEKNKLHWQAKATKAIFESGLAGFSNWMKWVEVQPVFRKIFGCSFLPHHDYGKGGRGWRDLWQDCLSLILLEPEEVKSLLVNNFGGVRIDGSNATIIGSEPGEFIADRNNIPRVWMDHGSWPYLTTKLYIDQTGDLAVLFENQTYFRDAQTGRAAKKDEDWSPLYGDKLKTGEFELYEGTILEHILLQHLSCFYNVGEHNIIRLECGDWNDTLDMARQRGESTAFTAFYGSNLMSIADLLRACKSMLKIETLSLCSEIVILLDTLHGSASYDDIQYKNNVLSAYFAAVSDHVSGQKVVLPIDQVISDLEQKGQWTYEHIRKQEYIQTADGSGFFNGYYNNDGQQVDGVFPEGIRMNLTGQVFTTMFGLATETQVLSSYNSCRKYLKDSRTGGYKLNTPLGPNTLNLGRGFAFAYGEKENGAIFSHMVVMYMNALYKRGFVNEAYEVFQSMYDLCMDTKHSKIYPGIPEYFSLSGKGMYHYLTGAASWLFLTVLTEMFGIRGSLGDLVINPKLVPDQFDSEGKAVAATKFAGQKIRVEFINKMLVPYLSYSVQSVIINGKEWPALVKGQKQVQIPRQELLGQAAGQTDEQTAITVVLG